MFDIIDITESQARVLRAIAYQEVESGMKGATQYSCYRKVPNGLHVSGSTFNDNIRDLEEKRMVTHLEIKNGDRKSKPYSITDIGQVAWLRYFPTSENIEIVQKIFPNLQLVVIDDIINQIQHPGMKYLKNKFADGILRLTLNSFHIETTYEQKRSLGMLLVEERIELDRFQGNKISFTRPYNIIEPSLLKKLKESNPPSSPHLQNFNELKISVIDRITFLFYYNLFQSVTNISSFVILNKIVLLETNMYKIINNKKIKILPNFTIEETLKFSEMLIDLSREVTKKKKEIRKIVVSNEAINKIIQNNLNNLKEDSESSFQEIIQIFTKTSIF